MEKFKKGNILVYDYSEREQMRRLIVDVKDGMITSTVLVSDRYPSLLNTTDILHVDYYNPGFYLDETSMVKNILSKYETIL